MKVPVSKNPISLDRQLPRDYVFDNMRAVLIVLVVWGHLLTSMISKYDLIKSLYFFVFFFHMPAMAFVSGYFSKNLEKGRNNAFEAILMPYLVLNVFNYLFKMFIIGEPYFGFRFFRPLWGLWYLLALFLWKFFLKDLIKIRYLLPLSFVIGLLSGYSKEFSNYMALGRVVCFLPFFLMGYYCTQEHVKIIRKLPKVISVLVIVAVGSFSTWIVGNDIFKVEVLYLRKAYPENSEFEGMFFRLIVYAVALLMTAVIINLMSNKKSLLSKIGTGTLTVYILHLFTIPLLEKLKVFYNQPYLYLLYSVFMTALITIVYSSTFVKKLYDGFMDKLIGIVLRK
ncbi:acyltransferase family protein [Mobilitalea sibirica]|uniref:Acyltransferase family protein n=1 Tax=Mobilitalea sibirica TaxID=1462919 RepID=A0A8J7KXA3_9FIRM|nr:acyltransferase family protein [Mobilitalea sibirica]MBH1941547.1 acyltransferase family protein [Mobilitalea sibirica]